MGARGTPTLLLYGEDDPWIVPFWAWRAANRISSNRSAQGSEYYALSPAGHCPHHETPIAFNRVLVNWIQRMEGGLRSASNREFASSVTWLEPGDISVGIAGEDAADVAITVQR